MPTSNTLFKIDDLYPEKGWVATLRAVLCLIRDTPRQNVLLIRKKTGLGAGLINMPGGKIEQGETPVEAAIRETEEEVGLVVDKLRHAGDLYFQFIDGISIQCYIFDTDCWSGDLRACPEADPLLVFTWTYSV